MRRTTRRAALLAAFAVTTAVPALTHPSGPTLRADDAKVTGDLKKMQGTWSSPGEGDVPKTTWVIDGENLKADVDGQAYTCTIKLDPKAEPIPTIDILVKDGPGDSAGKTSKGIYKFDDEMLVLCVTHPGGDTRPTEFKRGEDESFVFSLKKAK
jgi:uncharacterized protein (TIGR03067 family)